MEKNELLRARDVAEREIKELQKLDWNKELVMKEYVNENNDAKLVETYEFWDNEGLFSSFRFISTWSKELIEVQNFKRSLDD